jgi:hypothetical protein
MFYRGASVLKILTANDVLAAVDMGAAIDAVRPISEIRNFSINGAESIAGATPTRSPSSNQWATQYRTPRRQRNAGWVWTGDNQPMML